MLYIVSVFPIRRILASRWVSVCFFKAFAIRI